MSSAAKSHQPFATRTSRGPGAGKELTVGQQVVLAGLGFGEQRVLVGIGLLALVADAASKDIPPFPVDLAGLAFPATPVRVRRVERRDGGLEGAQLLAAQLDARLVLRPLG